MPEFVLNRTYVLDGDGHKIRFEKGQPTFVPTEMIKLAVGIGAEPLDGPVDVLGPEEQETIPLTQAEKEEQFFAAFEKLTASNERDDFDGAGQPTIDALKKRIDFSFVKKDITLAWRKFREKKAAEE